MLLNERYALPNGALIPKIGLGTWCIPDDQAAQAVESAVKLGYVSSTPRRPTATSAARAKACRLRRSPRRAVRRQQGDSGAEIL